MFYIISQLLQININNSVDLVYSSIFLTLILLIYKFLNSFTFFLLIIKYDYIRTHSIYQIICHYILIIVFYSYIYVRSGYMINEHFLMLESNPFFLKGKTNSALNLIETNNILVSKSGYYSILGNNNSRISLYKFNKIANLDITSGVKSISGLKLNSSISFQKLISETNFLDISQVPKLFFSTYLESFRENYNSYLLKNGNIFGNSFILCPEDLTQIKHNFNINKDFLKLFDGKCNDFKRPFNISILPQNFENYSRDNVNKLYHNLHMLYVTINGNNLEISVFTRSEQFCKFCHINNDLVLPFLVKDKLNLPVDNNIGRIMLQNKTNMHYIIEIEKLINPIIELPTRLEKILGYKLKFLDVNHLESYFQIYKKNLNIEQNLEEFIKNEKLVKLPDILFDLKKIPEEIKEIRLKEILQKLENKVRLDFVKAKTLVNKYDNVYQIFETISNSNKRSFELKEGVKELCKNKK